MDECERECLEIKLAQFALGDKKMVGMTKEEEDQYCRNGDRQGYLVRCYDEKHKAGNIHSQILEITDEEFSAKIADLRSQLKANGGSDGSF